MKKKAAVKKPTPKAKGDPPKAAPKGKPAKPAKAPKAAPPPEKAAARGKPPATAAANDIVAEMLESFATSNRISCYMVENLDEATWHAAPPGSRGRTIAAIVCHMHNVRVRWLDAARRQAKGPKPPPKLDHLAATQEDAVKALQNSHGAIAKILAGALRGEGKVANFKAGAAAFLYYLMTHDAHHRGQICLQAKLVGHPLAQAVAYGMWEWSKR